MGLFSKVFLGVDLDEEQKRQDELDAKLANLNAKALADGKIDQAAFEQTQDNLGKGRIDVDAEVAQAAKEGFNEGVDNIRGAAGSILALPFRFIPFIGWILIGAIVFWYLGGPALLRGYVARRARA